MLRERIEELEAPVRRECRTSSKRAFTGSAHVARTASVVVRGAYKRCADRRSAGHQDKTEPSRAWAKRIQMRRYVAYSARLDAE